MPRFAVRSALLVLAAWLALPALAEAATFTVPRADGQRATVNWPLERAGSAVAGGTRLRVQVKQPSRRAVLVTVRLDRLGPRSTIRAKRLRRGVAAFTVPRSAGRYELVLKARGKVVRRTRLQVSAAGAGGEPGTPGAGEPGVPASCPLDATIAGQLGEVTSTNSHPEYGTYFSAELRNTGTGCLGHPKGGLERLVDGSWHEVPAPLMPEPAVFLTVPPGSVLRVGAWLAPGLPAGEYRLVAQLQLYAGEPGTLPPPKRALRTFTYGGIAP